jgi:hypothetical protein
VLHRNPPSTDLDEKASGTLSGPSDEVTFLLEVGQHPGQACAFASQLGGEGYLAELQHPEMVRASA